MVSHHALAQELLGRVIREAGADADEASFTAAATRVVGNLNDEVGTGLARGVIRELLDPGHPGYNDVWARAACAPTGEFAPKALADTLVTAAMAVRVGGYIAA